MKKTDGLFCVQKLSQQKFIVLARQNNAHVLTLEILQRYVYLANDSMHCEEKESVLPGYDIMSSIRLLSCSPGVLLLCMQNS